VTDTTTAPVDTPATDRPAPDRSVDRRRSLPGGRAVVGAFLVTLAAVGIFAAYLRASAEPTTSWVVAARDLLPGDVVTAADITTVAIDLPDAQARRTANNPDAMLGRVVISPLFADELVGVGDTADGADVEGTSALTFPIETSRALGGSLAAGDRVDVVATFEDATRFVAIDLPVVEATTDGAVTSVTLATSDPSTVLAVANAIDTSEVFLAATNPEGSATTTDAVGPRTRTDVATPADDGEG
jgi:Flp pilus assembly protein CpaB